MRLENKAIGHLADVQFAVCSSDRLEAHRSQSGDILRPAGVRAPHGDPPFEPAYPAACSRELVVHYIERHPIRKIAHLEQSICFAPFDDDFNSPGGRARVLVTIICVCHEFDNRIIDIFDRKPSLLHD